MNEWKKDAFGNDLRIGDRVVASVIIGQSPGLRMGTIIKESKTCTEINWKDYLRNKDVEKSSIIVQKYLIHWDNMSIRDYCYNKEQPKDSVIKSTNLVKIS